MSDYDYSVIMPVKDAEKTIIQSLESIFSQTILPKEIIVIDDNSTDRTFAVVQTYSPIIKVMLNPKSGVASAVNFAIPQVATKYISFLDSDDLWMPTKAEKQIEYLINNPTTDVVCSSVLNFSKEHFDDVNFQATREFAPSRLFTASTFRQVTFEKFGPLNESVGHFGWIYTWWSRADEAGIKTGAINEVHLQRRIHENNSGVVHKDEGHKTLIDLARDNIRRRAHDKH